MDNPAPKKVGLERFKAHPPEVREQAARLFAEGKTVREISDLIHVHTKTIEKWLKRDGDPRPVAPPPVVGKSGKEPSAPRATSKRNVAKTPLSADKCGEILAGLFAAFAWFVGPGVQLTPAEKAMLGEDLANMSGILPRWLRDAIDTYTSPVIFTGHLSLVVNDRYNRIQAAIAERDAEEARAGLVRHAPFVPVKPEAPPAGQTAPRPAPPQERAPVTVPAGIARNGRLRDLREAPSAPTAPDGFGS